VGLRLSEKTLKILKNTMVLEFLGLVELLTRRSETSALLSFVTQKNAIR
jgi:hypothetical protein